MTRRAALFILALFATTMLNAAPAQDLTGKWTGTFVMSMNGESRDDVIEMNLTQKDKVLTGTAGPNADQQWPILEGKVDGPKVTFQVQSEGPLVKFTLALVDGRLKGDAAAAADGISMTAKVDAGRAK